MGFNKIFQKKTFSLNHDLDVKIGETERLYDPRRVRWMHYITIPLLFGFALLLVLSNVDFTDESKLKVTVSTTAQLSKTTAATITIKVSSDLLISTARDVITGAIDTAVQDKTPIFNCYEKDLCKTIVCTGGPIHTLAIDMENFDRTCGNVYFDVIIENCTFNEKTITQYTMSGLYNINSLTICNCELENIMHNAFKHATVKKLANLTFDGVQLNLLNAKSFMGLQNLEHFKLRNTQQAHSASLSFEHFLQPMASTLTTLVLQQTHTNYSATTIYDPKDWLGGNAIYKKLLDVDLSDTNFNDTLNRDTFANLLAVRRLSLSNCSLTLIAKKTFDYILPTLQWLDLRDNKLHMLDGEFLSSATLEGINIDITGNQWSCLCENRAIVEFVKQLEKSYGGGPECASPKEVRGVDIRYVQLQCNDQTTLPASTTTTPLTNPTTESELLSPTTVNTFLEIPPSRKPTTINVETNTISSYYDITTQRMPNTEINITPWNDLSTLEINATSENTLPAKPSIEDPPPSKKPITIPTPKPEISTTSKTTTTTGEIPTSLPPDYQGCYLPLPWITTCYNSSLSCIYGNFSVEASSSTSVRLQIGSYEKPLEVIFFEASNYSATSLGEIARSPPESILNVTDLKSNQSYTFCLIQYRYLRTSPFDCRSTHVPVEASISWLNNKNKTIFYASAICITIVCCIIGAAVIYYLLRWRPTLLYGSKRLRRVDLTTHEVLLLAKSDNSKNRYRLSKNHSDVQSYDYIQYFRQIDLNKHRVISRNRPPIDRAPTAPHRHSDTLRSDESDKESVRVFERNKRSPRETMSQQTGVLPTRHQKVTANELENEYESLDFYQELY